jgi:hypothetical protein
VPREGARYRFRDGVEAASQLCSRPENFQIHSPKIIFQPIDLGPGGDQTFLELYGTGIRGRARLEDVGALIGGMSRPVEFAKEQGELVGVDLARVQTSRFSAWEQESRSGHLYQDR